MNSTSSAPELELRRNSKADRAARLHAASNMWGRHSPAINGAVAGTSIVGLALSLACGGGLIEQAVFAFSAAACGTFAYLGGRPAPAGA